MTTIAPNPLSPYADADPAYRHMVAVLLPGLCGDPAAGALLPTACERLAVVPDEPLTDPEECDTLPDGLCPECVRVVGGGKPPTYPVTNCRDCGCFTDHDGLCSGCRRDRHEEWWPTRDHADAERTIG